MAAPLPPKLKVGPAGESSPNHCEKGVLLCNRQLVSTGDYHTQSTVEPFQAHTHTSHSFTANDASYMNPSTPRGPLLLVRVVNVLLHGSLPRECGRLALAGKDVLAMECILAPRSRVQPPGWADR